MRLFGHDEQIAAFRDAMASRRVHHAWLLAGPTGIGKGSFARLAASRLLDEAAGRPSASAGFEATSDDPTARLVAAAVHPDLELLDRQPADVKLREGPRPDWPDNVELARNIKVGQVRELRRRFATRPTLSKRRVVIVDAADDLEPAGANALLKNLEEPPAETIFLLIAHNPGRLLPTIRSRCRMLRFKPLGDADMAAAIRDAMPAMDGAEVASLVRAGDGAPGAALRLAGLGVSEIDRAIAELIASGDPDNDRRAALADKLAPRASQARYELFLKHAPSAIVAHARTLHGAALARAIALWEQTRDLAGVAVQLSLDPQPTVFEIAGKLAALAPTR